MSRPNLGMRGLKVVRGSSGVFGVARVIRRAGQQDQLGQDVRTLLGPLPLKFRADHYNRASMRERGCRKSVTPAIFIVKGAGTHIFLAFEKAASGAGLASLPNLQP